MDDGGHFVFALHSKAHVSRYLPMSVPPVKQVFEFTDESWWARKDSNLRPMDYESTALVVSVVQKSRNINTSKHLNPALVCLEWTGGYRSSV